MATTQSIGVKSPRSKLIRVILRLYWGYIGIMENKMETTIVGLYRDYYIRVI